jgi:hypothetical protein
MYKYKALKVNGKRIDEHRFIMEQFLGRKLETKEVVHHIDGNMRNNDISNLKVESLSEHSRHHQLGWNCDEERRKKASAAAIARNLIIFKKQVLNRDQVLEIILLSNHMRFCDIAKLYGVHRCTIGRIAKGQAWAECQIKPKAMTLK